MINNTFKSLSDLSKGIKEKIGLIDSGKYGLKELENALIEVNELNERLIVLKYKAIEQLAASVNNAQEASPNRAVEENENNPDPSSNTNQMTIMDGIKEVTKETTEDKFSSENTTVGEQLNDGQTSLAEQMENSTIANIRDAIGVNQKFSFRKNLFSDSVEAYDSALKRIETSNSLNEALEIVNGLRVEHSWDAEDETVIEFEELLNRRFGA